MLNSTILLKVKERLNKLDSNDYTNIQPWKIVEAFNKGQYDWCRRNLHGLNIVKEGDESSISRIDDLEVLIKSTPLILSDRQTYFESNTIPDNYLRWSRISSDAKSDCCPKRPLTIYLSEQANVDELLRDFNKKPNFDWAETFATVKGKKIQIYTNGEFSIENAILTYYRQPVRVEITGVKDPYTNLVPTTDIICEFKDDLVELLIDECVKILAGDIESINQVQIEGTRVENNN